MTNPLYPETGPVLLVDCPLCDRPAPVDAALTTLDCAACGVRIEVAADPEAPDLAVAA